MGGAGEFCREHSVWEFCGLRGCSGDYSLGLVKNTVDLVKQIDNSASLLTRMPPRSRPLCARDLFPVS